MQFISISVIGFHDMYIAFQSFLSHIDTDMILSSHPAIPPAARYISLQLGPGNIERRRAAMTVINIKPNFVSLIYRSRIRFYVQAVHQLINNCNGV